jgi:hypothetical protein
MKMKRLPALLSSLALGLILAGCNDNDEYFEFPGAGGAALPFTVMKTLTNADSTQLRNGGFGSAMAAHPSKEGYFYALTDRGPNAATAAGVKPSGIIFAHPEYTPRIGLFKLSDKGEVMLVETILLKDRNGRPITGLPNKTFGGTGETPYALDGSVVTLDPDGDGIAGYDESGLDGEGLVAMKDGTFWVSDEYGPHMVHFDKDGKEIGRINPFAADSRNKVGRLLPAELSKRWPNRGMEGLTITPDGKTLVGIMQSNLYNPSSAVGGINLTRIVTVNIETGAVAQYLHKQDAAGLANSEIVALTPTTFLIIERDTKFYGISTAPIRKNIYKIDLAQATNVNTSNANLINGQPAQLSADPTLGLLVGGKTLEQVIKDADNTSNFAAGWAQLDALGIKPATKTLVYDGVAGQKYPHDKMEGLWVIDSTRLGILNDDDFAIAPDGTGGVLQKKLHDGKVDTNMLYVIKLATPMF